MKLGKRIYINEKIKFKDSTVQTSKKLNLLKYDVKNDQYLVIYKDENNNWIEIFLDDSYKFI